MIEAGAFKDDDRAFAISFAMYSVQVDTFIQINIIMHRSLNFESDLIFYDDVRYEIIPFRIPLKTANFGVWLLLYMKFFFALQIFVILLMQVFR